MFSAAASTRAAPASIDGWFFRAALTASRSVMPSCAHSGARNSRVIPVRAFISDQSRLSMAKMQLRAGGDGGRGITALFGHWCKLLVVMALGVAQRSVTLGEVHRLRSTHLDLLHVFV